MEESQRINWKRTPFLRLILPLIAGILISIYFKIDSFYWSIPFITLVGFILFLHFQKKIVSSFAYNYIFGIALYTSLFLGGINLTVFRTEYNYDSHYLHKIDQANYSTKLIVEIDEIPKQKPKSLYTVVSIKAIENKGEIEPAIGKLILYFEKDSMANTILQGDQLIIQCNLQNIGEPRNPEEFNYSQYLYFHQIYQQAYVASDNWKSVTKGGWSLKKVAGKSRDFLLSKLKENGLEGEQLAVASALILGYKDDLSEDLKHAYSSTGAMHVLAVSGLHVGIIFMVLNNLLKFMDKSRKLAVVKLLILLVFLWFYAFITGLSPSVIRASTMFSFVIVGGAFNRVSSIYNTLASSGFVLLCYDPYLVMEVGFQLSYLAVLGIVYFQPKIYKLVYCKNWLLDKIWGITAVSIAAQIATFPLGLLYFHQFPVYFLFSNLVVIPGAMIIIGLGILLFVTSGFTAIASIIGIALNEVIYWMNYLVLSIDKLPFSLIEGISISILGSWIIYALIISTVPILEFRKLRYFNVALVLFITFLAADIIEDYHLRVENEIVLFDVKNEVVLNFVDAEHNYFFASDELINDRSKMQFHIKNYWHSKDAASPMYLSIDENYEEKGFYKNGPFYFFNDKVLFHLNEPFSTKNAALPIINHSIDMCYITQVNASSFEDIMQFIHPKVIVIGNDVSKKEAQKITAWCEQNKVEVHDIKKEGAYVLTYN
jgi:competence protein ComEC